MRPGKSSLLSAIATILAVSLLTGCQQVTPAAPAATRIPPPVTSAAAATTAPAPKAPASTAAPAATTKPAAAASTFYQGKTITLIVPNSPGKGMDTYARMIVPYLKKSSGAQDIIVQNITGAGGLQGINTLWNSKPDGLTIAFTSVPTLILAELAGSDGVQFQASKFTYLGRTSTEARVLAVGGTSKITSIDDLKNLSRPFVFPTQGTDDDFYTMAILARSIGFTLKAVTGYQGNADTALAVVKGEGDGQITALSDAEPMIKQGDKRPILMISAKRVEGYPEVPTALEVTSGDGRALMQTVVNMIDLHRSFFGPPNMDPTATAALRSSIGEALGDPELKAKAASTGLPIAFMDGAQEQQTVDRIAKDGQVFVPILQQALKSIQ